MLTVVSRHSRLNWSTRWGGEKVNYRPQRPSSGFASAEPGRQEVRQVAHFDSVLLGGH